MTTRMMVRAGGAALLLMIVFAAGFAAWRIDVIRMGGIIQRQSQQTSDLVADVLPPPAYVIEAFLETTLLLRDPADAPGAARRLAKLRNDYRIRLSYWSQSGIDPAVYAALSASKPAGDAFWAEVEGRFLPAARAKDQAAMVRSYAVIAENYAAHRKAIDALVERALAYQAGLNDRAAATLRSALIMLSIIGLMIVGGVAAFSAMLVRRVVTPTVTLSVATAALARGESAVVPYLDRTDELGSIASAVEQFRCAANARTDATAAAAAEQRLVTDELAKVLRTIAAGDLSEDATIDVPPAYHAVAENLNSAIATLRSMIQSVVETATEIEGSAVEIATASRDLARRTEGTAANLEESNAALSQIDQRLRSATAASSDTVGRADSALASVASGRSTTAEAVQAMARVAASAKGTDAVIEGLDKIAFQTRVLAMNAAVEAGRAGEAGRGFAVVADLVSALAQRAEEEAQSARAQLTTTQVEIGTAVGAVERVDASLAAIARDVDAVHGLLGGMVTDNQAQSQSVAEVSAAVGNMDRTTQQNAAMVEQTSAAADNLSSRIQSLVGLMSAFQFERRKQNIPVAAERRAGGWRVARHRSADPAAAPAHAPAHAPAPGPVDALRGLVEA